MNNLILTNPNRKMEQAIERIGQFGGAALVLSDSRDVGCLNPSKSLDILEFTEEDTTSRLNPWRCPDFYIYCFNEWAKDISGLFCQAYGLPKSCWKVWKTRSLRSANGSDNLRNDPGSGGFASGPRRQPIPVRYAQPGIGPGRSGLAPYILL